MDKKVSDVLDEACNILYDQRLYNMENDAFRNVLVARDFIRITLGTDFRSCIGAVSVNTVKDQLRSQGELPEEQTRLEFPNGVKITFVHYDLPNWEYHDKETKYTACFITYRNSGKNEFARCHPNDVYNRYFGEKLALRRALKHIARDAKKIDGNLDAKNLEEMIKDKKFYQEIWRAFFEANGLNERGEK